MSKIRFMYQYLKDEKLHYLAELHDDDGVLGEDFFDNTEEFLEHTKANNINFVGEVDAELMLTELLTKNIRIEYDKEHGMGAYDVRLERMNENITKQLQRIYDDINDTNCGNN